MTALLLLAFGPQEALDVRRDVYPVPPVESRFVRHVPLPGGGAIEAIAACSVTSKGATRCWNVTGKDEPKLLKEVNSLLKERDRLRFVPEGDHRFVVFSYAGKPTRRVQVSMGGDFVGFFNYRGRHCGSRLLLNSGSAKTLGIHVDVMHPARATMPVKEGATAKIGRGTVRIKRLEKMPGGALRIYPATSDETFYSLMFSALDRSGKQIVAVDRAGKPMSKFDMNKSRNGLGMGSNTLALSPALVSVDPKYIGSLVLDAPYVRRYILGGVPANSR